MHELSIAMSILESLQEEVDRRGCGTVEAVHVRIGRMSGIVPDSLQFSYEIAAADTPFAHTRLEVEEIPVVIHCAECGRDREVESMACLYCPECKTPSFDIVSGRELEIYALELAS